MFAKIFTVAILAAGHCQAAIECVRGGTTCICTDTETKTDFMYGPCSASTTAPSFLKQTLLGGGLVSTTDGYWVEPTTGKFEKIPILSTNGIPNSYGLRADKNLVISGQDGCEYAAAQASAKIGLGTNTGVFQYAAMISTGTKACTTDKVTVIKPKDGGCTGETDCGLTQGICIKSDGTTCQTKSFEPGTIKFSAGFAIDSFTATTVPISGGTNTITNMGYRLMYDYSKMAGDLYFNGDTAVTLANIGTNVDVKSFTIKDGDKSVTITTGGMYTWGTFDSTADTVTLGGSTAIVCRAAMAGAAADKTFYVDFLFDATHIGANKWVLYDPTVSSTGGSQAGSAHVVASAFTVAILAAVALFQL